MKLRPLALALACAFAGIVAAEPRSAPPAPVRQAVPAGAPERARFPSLKLDSGASIAPLEVGYRTFGTLDADRGNVVVLLTWFGGQSEQAAGLVGANALFDPAHHYVIVIDALANGVSSSPSTSASQARMAFPVIGIPDMVAASRLLLHETFGIDRVAVLAGVSMGGMQVFEWIVHEPEFAEAAVVIQGSPRLTPHDLLLWQSTVEAIRRDPVWNGGNYSRQPARRALYYIGMLSGQSPTAINRTMTREGVLAIPAMDAPVEGFDANDHIRQVEAMLRHDVAREDGGDLAVAARRVRTRLFYAYHPDDRVVRPEPGLEFARVAGARIVALPGDCGHAAYACEQPFLAAALRTFLEAKSATP